MQRTDIALGLGGAIALTKFTLTFSDLTTAGLTQTITLQENPGGSQVLTTNFTLNPGAKVLGVVIKHSVAFAGTAITATTVSLGNAAGGATFYAPAFDIFQAVADNTLQETGGLFRSGSMAASGLQAFFTSVGGNLNVATAGSVDIYVCYLNVTMPSGV